MAGRIPESFINDLLARVDIVDVIDEHVPLKKAGRNYQARCPFHDERTPSFSVSPDKQFFYCFGCGASGSAIGFLMDYQHMDFVEAVHDLADRAGLAVPVTEGAEPRIGDLSRLYGLLEQAQQFYSQQLRAHEQAARARDYLKKRGLDGPTAAHFKLGYAPPGWDNLLRALGSSPEPARALEAAGLLVPKDGGGHYDRFRDRVMFPILDQRGRVIGFGGRVLGDEEPKYLNSPETPVFHKGRELYGLHEARKANRQFKQLIIVEGYMDVIALHQFGITQAVATLGTATTREHLERSFKITPEVVFCFDGDEAGRRAAWRALEVALPVLAEGRYAGFLFLPGGEDPDTLIRAQGPAIFENSAAFTSLSDFLFNTLSAQVNLSTLDGRARLVDLAKPHLQKIPGIAFRQLLAQRLAKLSGIEFGALAPMLGLTQHRPKARRWPPSAGRQSPSLVRNAIRLLLHKPALALQVGPASELDPLDIPGGKLLQALVELVQGNPNLNSGALLEHWRDQEEGAHLKKLLSHEIGVPEEGMEGEFSGAWKRLRRMAVKLRAEKVAKLRPSEMSDEEKTKLRHRVILSGGQGGAPPEKV